MVCRKQVALSALLSKSAIFDGLEGPQSSACLFGRRRATADDFEDAFLSGTRNRF
jgi:hypothetical protein